MLVSEEKAATIRDELKREQKVWHHKPRFGLFSYLPDHGFGFRDDKWSKTQNFKDEFGRVKTSPKNFQIGRPGTAHPSIDTFTKTGYLCNNDEYIDPTKTLKLRESQSTRNQPSATFRPSGGNFYKTKAPFEYLSEVGEPTQAAPARKNFLTSPMKKGMGNTTNGHLFSSYGYESSPYDYSKELSSLERRQHADKKLHGPFQTTFKKRDQFTSNRKLHYVPDELRGEHKRSTSSNGFKPFLNTDPIKTGYNLTIEKFPQYQEEGIQPKQFFGTKGDDKIWKHTYKEKTVPTPSVHTYNKINRPRQRS